MKTLVFGKGYLGTRLAETLGYKQTDFRVINQEALGRYLDIENPDFIINAIGKTGGPGYTGIDFCEFNKAETNFSNVIVPQFFSEESKKRGINWMHFSSGCIYRGDNGGKRFTEKDQPNFEFTQHYAKTKIYGERTIDHSNCLVLRIRMPIDDRPSERNLIDKLSKYSKVIDIPNSMTTVPDMIPAIDKLIQKRVTGIYNFTNPGTISAYEIMTLYKQIVNKNHKFEKLSREELNKITIGERSNCVLDTYKLKRVGIYLPHIYNATRSCLIEYAKRC